MSGQGTNMLTLQATGASGYYQIGVRVANNCDAGGSPAIQTTYFSGCGFAPVYMVYPNPATSTITTTAKAAAVKSINRSAPIITQINIYDVQGVLKKHVLFNKVKTAKVDVSGLMAGAYYIEIFDGIHKETQQLQILKQ